MGNRGGRRPGLTMRTASGFAQSFQAYRPELLRFLTGRLGCRSTAEDLAQESFLRLLGAQQELRSPKAFLFKVAGNLALDHGRVEGRRKQLLAQAAETLWDEEDEMTPERDLGARMEVAHIMEALTPLPPVAREIFYLCHFERMTQCEAAAALGISRKAVIKHLRAVMDRLSAVVAELNGPDNSGE
jgi:RNA polymerase sigma factor (sigma-70 family)